jgi:hypothetical protein
MQDNVRNPKIGPGSINAGGAAAGASREGDTTRGYVISSGHIAGISDHVDLSDLCDGAHAEQRQFGGNAPQIPSLKQDSAQRVTRCGSNEVGSDKDSLTELRETNAVDSSGEVIAARAHELALTHQSPGQDGRSESDSHKTLPHRKWPTIRNKKEAEEILKQRSAGGDTTRCPLCKKSARFMRHPGTCSHPFHDEPFRSAGGDTTVSPFSASRLWLDTFGESAKGKVTWEFACSFAELYLTKKVDVAAELRERVRELERELNGTPDNAVWGKQKWIENAAYWNEAWKKAIEQRDDSIASNQILTAELKAAESRAAELHQELAKMKGEK